MYLPEQTHVAALVTIRRDRHLPVPGEVLPRMGQRVEAMDMVARAVLAPVHRLLDIAHILGVSPAEADKLMQHQAADSVKAGDVLARRRGLAGRSVIAPFDGRVVAAGGGQMLLQATPEPRQLRAIVPGTVVGVAAGIGVTIETTGAVVQAAWGNGREDFGVMRVLATEPGSPLTSEQMEVGLRGAVLCGGIGSDPGALRVAGEMQLRGLILGSLASALRETAERLPFPVILTEGWGERPMSAPAFQLLKTNAGREVALDATPTDRYLGTRPEIVIPLPAAGVRTTLPNEGESLTAGQRVRVVRAPYAGAVGILTALGDQPVGMPSGLRAMSARVELEGFGNVWVPFCNLEILE